MAPACEIMFLRFERMDCVDSDEAVRAASTATDASTNDPCFCVPLEVEGVRLIIDPLVLLVRCKKDEDVFREIR